MEKTSKRLKEDSKENLVAEIVGLNVRLENLKSQIQLRDKKIEELIEKKRDTYFLNMIIGVIAGVISGLILACSQSIFKENFIGLTMSTVISGILMLLLIKGMWNWRRK